MGKKPDSEVCQNQDRLSSVLLEPWPGFCERYVGQVVCSGFLDCHEATRYFDRFFSWYNTKHYHSGIDYVTPQQCHQGLRDKIVSERKAKQANQQNFRKEVNRLKSLLTNSSENFYNNQINLMTCSLIPP